MLQEAPAWCRAYVQLATTACWHALLQLQEAPSWCCNRVKVTNLVHWENKLFDYAAHGRCYVTISKFPAYCITTKQTTFPANELARSVHVVLAVSLYALSLV